VETRGIIRTQGKKEPRFHRLFLEWDENEIYEALKDKQMITSILANKSVLNSMK
jgi:cell division control protein 6